MQAIKLNKISTILLVVAVLAVSGATFFYLKANRLQSQPEKMSSTLGSKEIIEEVSKIIVLPENEEPTVATVSDPNKIKDQPFFVNAKTGDKVLIYLKAKKAFLYDPVAKKLIEVAPLSIDSSIPLVQ